MIKTNKHPSVIIVQIFKLFFALSIYVLLTLNAYAANNISAARVWPAQDYTRIALESDAPIKHQLIILKNPDRLVLDIENIELNNTLRTLSDKILSGDPCACGD